MGTHVSDASSEAKRLLCVEVVRSFGEAKLAITGTSMLPVIWPGDILEVRAQSVAEIFGGQVVVVERQGYLVAHRVVRKLEQNGETILVTRGDRLRRPDPPVSSQEVLGCVTAVLRGNRRKLPRMTLGCLVASWILCRSEFATRAFLRLAAFRRRPSPTETLWRS
jgi:signal peptidase I